MFLFCWWVGNEFLECGGGVCFIGAVVVVDEEYGLNVWVVGVVLDELE